MEITFQDRKLEKPANDDRNLVKEFGKFRADKITKGLNQPRFVRCLEDVK